MIMETTQSKPITFEGPAQGPTIGDNNKVDNYFDNRTIVTHVDGKEFTVPFLAPCLPMDHSIVGHEQLLDELKNALFTTNNHSLVVLPGVGKTTLAIEVANDEKVTRHFPDGVLWASLGHNPDTLGELKRWARALNVDKKTLAQVQSVEQGRVIVSSAIAQRRMLLVVDDVWQYDAAKVFGDLGSHCGHLFISRIPEIAIKFAVGKPTIVKELTNEEGMSLLNQYIPEVVKAEPQATLELVKASGGLPQALTLLGTQLKLEAYAGDSERIKDALKALLNEKKRQEAYGKPDGIDKPPTALAAAIELSFSHESLDDDVRQALQKLSILRPKPHTFPKELALTVIGVDDKKILYKLNDVGLIECIPGDGYTMQRTIAEYIREKLSADKLKICYQDTIEYFRKQMKEVEESLKSDGDYAVWYRYESRAWQAAKNNWLYYLSQSADESAAALAFLRAYFDAFWWWSCFLDFDYCNQLIKEWEQRESNELNRKILKLVRQFQDYYPKETEDRHSPTWTEVEASLSQLLQLVELDGDPSQWSNEDSRHVRGLADIFFAEVYRFGRNDLDTAAKRYQEASDLFRKNGDNWDLAWILCHFAELNFERGNTDTALDQSQQALSLGMQAKDPEVVALAYRLRGNIYLSLKDMERADDSYQRAVFHAYRFQADPSPPDPYTVRFYSGMVEHVLEKIKNLYVAHKAEAVALTEGMHHFWAPAYHLVGELAATPDFSRLWAESDIVKLKSCMFPAELLQERIDAQGPQYEKQVKAICAVQIETLAGIAGNK
jgi:hypothetical protein